jgi:hypothetical protein
MISDSLSILIDKVSGYDKEIADLDAVIKERKEYRDKILEDDIPSLLHENGLEYAPLSDGRVVSIDSIVSVSQLDKEKLRTWLEMNGYDSVIKTEFQFPKGSDTSYFEVMLRDEGVDFSKEIIIHPMTLKALMKEHLGSGGDYPPETAAKVSVYERAKIKEAK